MATWSSIICLWGKKKTHKKSLSCLYQATGSKEGKQLFGARKQKICLLFAGSACATSPGQCSPPAICFAWPKLHVPLQSQCGSRSSVSVSLSHQEQSDTLGQLPSQHLTSCYYHSFLVAPSLSVSPFWIHFSIGCREALLLPTWDRELGHRRFRVQFSEDERFSVALDIFYLSQNESATGGRKAHLSSAIELFTRRFQTLGMRDKASSLPGKAKDTELQNTEYALLLLTINKWWCQSSAVVTAPPKREKEGQLGREEHDGSLLSLPVMTLSFFPWNREQGDVLLLLGAYQQSCAWGVGMRALPPFLGWHCPGPKLLGLSLCSLFPHPAARSVSSKGILQMLFLVRFLVSAVEMSGGIAQHCLEAGSAKE